MRTQSPPHPDSQLTLASGGKAKPLKAPKKEKKEEDEMDKEFKAKQAAGIASMTFSQTIADIV